MYRFLTDRGKKRIEVKVSGFSDATQAAVFDAEMRAHVLSFKKEGSPFDIFVDLREALTLPQHYAEAIGRQMEWVAQQGLRKAAHVMASAIYTLQLKRISPDQRFRFFTEEQEALAWLDAEEP